MSYTITVSFNDPIPNFVIGDWIPTSTGHYMYDIKASDEFTKWAQSNLTKNYEIKCKSLSTIITFESEEDYLLFKLTWIPEGSK